MNKMGNGNPILNTFITTAPEVCRGLDLNVDRYVEALETHNLFPIERFRSGSEVRYILLHLYEVNKNQENSDDSWRNLAKGDNPRKFKNFIKKVFG